ncbi:MAG: cobyrinate a,c-diamide synthase, partial [Methanosarcinales archaeon]|nr:cobyrinate a,c-diamide synthase [Methanosarcinales archaeon]
MITQSQTRPPTQFPTPPSVIIAGTHSGVGKTTVSMGIMAALSKNLTVQPFKIGPDYIDPSHHTLICKRPSINLDSFMMEEEDIRRSFYAHSSGADISIIEGVMGLHDGVDSTEVASTAHIAKILGIPVVLVVDVKGMSRSTAALAYGYREYDRDVDVSAVILNRAGSERHIGQIKQSLGDVGIDVIGALPRNNDIVLPSRHLGLHMADESDFDYAALADFIEKHIDLQRVMDISNRCDLKSSNNSTQSLQSAQSSKPAQSAPKPDAICDVTIGIAQDSAFCFYYEEMFESLRDQGAKLVFFSPLHDTQLPDVDGLYFGGGYPELFAKELEASPVTKQIAEKAAAGMPIYGECGGFMYLCRSLEMKDAHYRFAGVLA